MTSAAEPAAPYAGVPGQPGHGPDRDVPRTITAPATPGDRVFRGVLRKSPGSQSSRSWG